MSRQHLNRAELEALHSVLRRAAERAERQRRSYDHQRLMQELAELEDQLREGV